MQTGRLRERLDIERPVESKGEGGGVSTTYSTQWSGVAARVEHLGGRQLFEAASVMPQATVRVTVWFLAGLTVAHRFREHDGTILNIGHIKPDERRTRMECLCERKMGQ